MEQEETMQDIYFNPLDFCTCSMDNLKWLLENILKSTKHWKITETKKVETIPISWLERQYQEDGHTSKNWSTNLMKALAKSQPAPL